MLMRETGYCYIHPCLLACMDCKSICCCYDTCLNKARCIIWSQAAWNGSPGMECPCGLPQIGNRYSRTAPAALVWRAIAAVLFQAVLARHTSRTASAALVWRLCSSKLLGAFGEGIAAFVGLCLHNARARGDGEGGR